MGVVSFLYALPTLFHQLANSELLHKLVPGAAPVPLGASELIPSLAIIPFMLYQPAGFGTLGFVVSRPVNWALNLAIPALAIGSYVANREASFVIERMLGGVLVLLMVGTVIYGVFKLKRMQSLFDAHRPPKAGKRHADEARAAGGVMTPDLLGGSALRQASLAASTGSQGQVEIEPLRVGVEAAWRGCIPAAVKTEFPGIRAKLQRQGVRQPPGRAAMISWQPSHLFKSHH